MIVSSSDEATELIVKDQVWTLMLNLFKMVFFDNAVCREMKEIIW